MAEPTFPAARAVAERVAAHFARQHERVEQGDAGRGLRTRLAPKPDADAIGALIDTAFWASLRREEGLTPKISLAWVPPADAGAPLTFEASLPLHASGLAKLAPAVERPGIHLGVWRQDGQLEVWGTTRHLPPLCLVIEVVASGLLVVKERGEAFGKFVNVAVMEGDEVKIVDERTASMPECPGVLKSLIRGDLAEPSAHGLNLLVELAASMRAHGRGGTLLAVPAHSTSWGESMVLPITYAIRPPFTGLSSLLRQPDSLSVDEWRVDLRRAVEAVASLTAVDGATLLADTFDLLAFGAKIVRRRGHPTVERVVVTEPVEGDVMTTAAPAQLGGTRHLSAAQFVHDQRDASALVASQDGRVTVFTWSPSEDAVRAFRIEALLL